MEKIRTYSREQLFRLLRWFGEINFNNQDDGSSIRLCKDKEKSFSIYQDQNVKWTLKNTGKKELYLDRETIVSDEDKELSEESFFLYSDENSTENNFLFGVDPKQKDLWKLSREDHRGLEIVANNFTKRFKSRDGREVNGIEELDFHIQASEFVGIYGGSGTGKTTLLESMISPAEKENFRKRIIKKIFKSGKDDCGSILFDGESASYYSMEIVYLPQNIEFPRELLCKDLLTLAMFDRGEKDVINQNTSIGEVLALCTLDEAILNKTCGSLSGGQRRRLALAMALLKKKVRLLVLDEPTTGLDPENELSVMQTLKRLSRHGITVVCVTHSVVSRSLFDRVLILRKPYPDHAATLCFKSKWEEKSFDDKRLKGFKDEERLWFLINPDSGLTLSDGSLEEKEEGKWPYPVRYKKADNTEKQIDNAEGSQTAKELWLSKHWKKIKDATCRGWNKLKKSLIDFFSRTTLRQSLTWFKCGLSLIYKDHKSIINFSLLAVICVVIIQLGIATTASSHEKLVSMMLICAPWLCATYSAIFVTDLLRFYAWEKFSGLRAHNFVLGVFASLIFPALVLATIFSIGADFRLNHVNLSQSIVLSLWDSKPKSSDNPEKNTQFQNHNQKFSIQSLANVFNFDKLYKIKQEFSRKFFNHFLNNKLIKEFDKIKSDADKANADKTKEPDEYSYKDIILSTYNIYDFDEVENKKEVEENKNKECKHGFEHVLLSVFVICMVGVGFGIFAASIFKKAKSATVFLVVLFIFFLMFGRLFCNERSSTMLPISILLDQNLDCCQNFSETQSIFPRIVSYFSISRYSYTLVEYPDWKIAMWDALPLLAFLIVSLCLASVCLSNKSKIWGLISR